MAADWIYRIIDLFQADINVERFSSGQIFVGLRNVEKAETIQVNSNGDFTVRTLNFERFNREIMRSHIKKSVKAMEVNLANGNKYVYNVIKTEMRDDKLELILATNGNNDITSGDYINADIKFYLASENDFHVPFTELGTATWNQSSKLMTFKTNDQGVPLASVGKNLLITGKDDKGKTKRMVAKVKSVTVNNENTLLELTNKDFAPIGTTAKNAVHGFSTGIYNDFRILYEEPCEPQDCQYNKNAALSIDGTIKKVNKDAGTFQVDFKAMGRAITISGINVESENAGIFLEKMYKYVNLDQWDFFVIGLTTAVYGINASLGGIFLSGLKKNKDRWTATFKYGGDLNIKKGTKMEGIYFGFKNEAVNRL
jgi:hypothetical protein